MNKERTKLENKVWTRTHRDFRGKLPDGTKTILVYDPRHGTCLVAVADLTDEELRKRAGV